MTSPEAVTACRPPGFPDLGSPSLSQCGPGTFHCLPPETLAGGKAKWLQPPQKQFSHEVKYTPTIRPSLPLLDI